MAKLRKHESIEGEPNYSFECPGCGCYHGIWITPNYNSITKAAWTFDGDLNKPTITPSLDTRYDGGKRCHLFITNGRIDFLSDSTHELAGTSVEMNDIEA